MLKTSDWLFSPQEATGYLRNQVIDHLDRAGQIHHTEHLYFKIPKRYALINIQEPVLAALKRSKVTDGICFVSAMHITAGVYVNDAESGLLHDIAGWLEALAPFGKNYQHHQTGEDNGDAHLKSYLTNHSLTAPITRGKLDFGSWQQIFYAEFDGAREKRVLIKAMGIQ